MNCKANIIFGDSRSMKEIENEEIDLIITSPPYWNIKDYEISKQIGYGQTLHEYLKSLFHVWKECYRVLRKGGRICINIGDQFARSIVYGRYKVIPLHAEIISQCEQIGFYYMGFINSIENNSVSAYVYLKNKIFINANLMKLGLAAPNNSLNHKYKEKFFKLWKEKQNA